MNLLQAAVPKFQDDGLFLPTDKRLTSFGTEKVLRLRDAFLSLSLLICLSFPSQAAEKLKRHEIGADFGAVFLKTRDYALSAATYSGSRFRIPLEIYYVRQMPGGRINASFSYANGVDLSSDVEAPAFDNRLEYKRLHGAFQYLNQLTDLQNGRIKIRGGGGFATRYALKRQRNSRFNQSIASEIVEEMYAALSAVIGVEAALDKSRTSLFSIFFDVPIVGYSLRPPRYVKGSLKSNISTVNKFRGAGFVAKIGLAVSENLFLNFGLASDYQRLTRLHRTETAALKLTSGLSLKF